MRVLSERSYQMLTFLSSIGKQKCMRFRISGKHIVYGGGSISITMDLLILLMFYFSCFNDPLLVIVMFMKNIS